MVPVRPDAAGWAGDAWSAGGLPPALIQAARHPPEGGTTLILDAAGQDVIVVLGEQGGDARQMWAFIREQVTGKKAVRM
jgi:hypothetical protein